MKAVRILFGSHLFALAFGLAGLLIVIPHPELYANNPTVANAIPYGLKYTGSLHILLGASTMLVFGIVVIGWRKTLIFFAAATLIPLCAELIGTGTGFPFGHYSYTTDLGYKIMGRVPYSIPLSWFYMGFTSYLLATALIDRLGVRRRTLASLALGAYLLTAWDLVLDPAMASSNLPIRFWIWAQHGWYFGMPLQNFAGWCLTGFIFMSVSRALWRSNLQLRQFPLWLPFGMYLANMAFAICLSLGAGLWQPPIIAVVLGLLPATLAWRGAKHAGTGGSPVEAIARRVIRTGAGNLARGSLSVTTEGLEHVPAAGPVLIASRHYHHLYDGCALLTQLDRPVHILVGLDWVGSRAGRYGMEMACRVARWPVVLRSALGGATPETSDATQRPEARQYLRRAVETSVSVLRDGHILVLFPEAYPNIDPIYTPKTTPDAFLPFRPGFVRIAEMAGRRGGQRVPIVPAGLHYTRTGSHWHAHLRLGAPVYAEAWADHAALVAYVEQQVRDLSAPVPQIHVARAGSVQPASRDESSLATEL